jgi:hypothetical protein
MPFPSATDAPKRETLRSGKRRSNKYRIHFVFKDEDSVSGQDWRVEEVTSSTVESATTGVLKRLNADGGDWRKSDIRVMQAVVLNPPKDLEE